MIRKGIYGECSNSRKDDTDYSSCDLQLLTQKWASGNETIDKLIKSTQLEATKYDNDNYLQWISYDKLKDIEKIDEGCFATIYHATWIDGEKYIDKQSKERIIKDRNVALKKLYNSQKVSDDFLDEVNKFIIIVFSFGFNYHC